MFTRRDRSLLGCRTLDAMLLPDGTFGQSVISHTPVTYSGIAPFA